MLEECEKNVKWMLNEISYIWLIIECLMKYCKKKRTENREKDSKYIWEDEDHTISLLLFR